MGNYKFHLELIEKLIKIRRIMMNEWWTRSSSKSIGGLWSDVLGFVELVLEVSVVIFKLFDLYQGWLHVLLHDGIIFVASFWHVLDKGLEILFSFGLWKRVLFVDNVILNVFECIVELFDLLVFFIDDFAEFGDLFLEILLFLLELFLFILSFKGEFIKFLFKFFAVGRIFSSCFLILWCGFGDE